MRRIAAVMLLGATGCAAAPAEEAGEGPRIAPAAERVNEEEVQPPDDNGGGCGMPGPAGGTTGAAAGGIGDGGGDDVGSWGGEICRTACATVASVGCNTIWDACLLGELVTVGSITLPCGFGIVAACFGGAACYAECPS